MESYWNPLGCDETVRIGIWTVCSNVPDLFRDWGIYRTYHRQIPLLPSCRGRKLRECPLWAFWQICPALPLFIEDITMMIQLLESVVLDEYCIRYPGGAMMPGMMSTVECRKSLSHFVWGFEFPPKQVQTLPPNGRIRYLQSLSR